MAALARDARARRRRRRACIVDGVDATVEIRGPEVTRAVSIVAANPGVRAELRRRQREWAEPARRRGDRGPRHRHRRVPRRRAEGVPDRRRPRCGPQRRAKEVTDLDYETVAADIARRDALDQGRDDSPLTAADDAVSSTPPTAPSTRSSTTCSARLDGRAVTRRSAGGRSRSTAFVRGARSSASPRCSGAHRGRRRREHPDDRPVRPRAGAPLEHRLRRSSSLVTTRRMRYMGKDSLWKYKLLGRFFTALGGFPVHRGSGRPRGAAPCIDGDRARRAAGDVPRGHAPVGPGRRGAVRRRRLRRRAAPACRSCPSASAAPSGPCRRARSCIRPAKLALVVGEPLAPAGADESGRASAPRGARAHRAAARELQRSSTRPSRRPAPS